MEDDTLMGRPIRISEEVAQVDKELGEVKPTSWSHAWDGHAISLIGAGRYLEQPYHRSWRHRLFSWPWKPWCNEEVISFQATITKVEGATFTFRTGPPMKKTLRWRREKKWLIK